MGKLTAALPAADQIELIHALFGGPDFDSAKIPQREAYLATFEEAAGQRTATHQKMACAANDFFR